LTLQSIRTNKPAELAVLGDAMAHKGAIAILKGILGIEDFYWPENSTIWAAMVALEERGVSIDPVTIADELRTIRRLNTVSGLVDIETLKYHAGRDIDAVESHARIVAGLAMARRIESTAQSIAALALDPSIAVPDFADRAITALSEATKQRDVRAPAAMIDMAEDLTKRIEQQADAPEGITGVPSGLTQLDAITSGLQPGTLVIVAARPAMGKSSLATKLVKACAERNNSGNKASLLFSLEMPNKEQFERIACEQASIDAKKIKRRQLTSDDMTGLTSALNYVATLPIFIDDDSSVTPQDLRARALRQHSRTPLGLIAIDYLQLIMPPRTMGRDTRERQVTVIAEALKALAKELNIPVVALAQLNRSLEERPDKRPRLSDLRESGGLEQSADLVLFIYRDDYYNKDSADKGIAELIVAKQRGGDTSTAYARWIATLTRFQDLSDEELEELDNRKAAPNNVVPMRPRNRA